MLLTGRDATSSGGTNADGTNGSAASPSSRSMRAVPSDQEICHVLRQVQLGPLLDRVSGDAGVGLDTSADWASMLSLGEQQRLAFARYCKCQSINECTFLVFRTHQGSQQIVTEQVTYTKH